MKQRVFNFRFMEKQAICVTLSAVAVLVSMGLLFIKGPRYGVDFAGGTEILVALNNDVDADQVRQALKDDFNAPSVQSFENSRNRYLVRLSETSAEVAGIDTKVAATLKAKLPAGAFKGIEKNESIGAAAGKELRQRGFWAVFYTLLALLLYVAARFASASLERRNPKDTEGETLMSLGRKLMIWSRWGWGAILALFHDVIITIGVFIIVGKEFNLPTIAALLTIAGYSVNDTIVIYDRIRENIHHHSGKSMFWIMNLSINETLSRTFATNLTLIMVTFALWVWGGGIINDFALALTIGMVVGTYSSIYIASPIVAGMEKLFSPKSAAAPKGVTA